MHFPQMLATSPAEERTRGLGMSGGLAPGIPAGFLASPPAAAPASASLRFFSSCWLMVHLQRSATSRTDLRGSMDASLT